MWEVGSILIFLNKYKKTTAEGNILLKNLVYTYSFCKESSSFIPFSKYNFLSQAIDIKYFSYSSYKFFVDLGSLPL